MENPILLYGLSSMLERNQSRIGIRMDEEYERKACDLAGIMFLDIEYKGIMKKVLILQQEMSEQELKEVENELRKTDVKDDGIQFDYITLLEKEYLKEIRKQVMRGYPNGWHTYMIYLGEEPKIGIKVIIKADQIDKIIKEEKVKLVRMRDIKKEENRIEKRQKEHELDVISDMKKAELKPKKEHREWYNKYSKRFLRDLIRVERITKKIVVDERLGYYDENESDTELTREDESYSVEV